MSLSRFLLDPCTALTSGFSQCGINKVLKSNTVQGMKDTSNDPSEAIVNLIFMHLLVFFSTNLC